MITLRESTERGHANHGWLDSYFTFSFANYYDPRHMEFRSLRVLNEDRVDPGAGFPTHPHNDMEILTYVIEGSLEHRDSMGNGSLVRAGEFQRMTAGTGVSHSEFNPSKTEPLHLLQIWILPAEMGLTPGYEQKEFPRNDRLNALRVVASPSGRDASLILHQDAEVLTAVLEAGKSVEHRLDKGRHGWVQVISGSVEINGQPSQGGDGISLSREERIVVKANEEADVLLFDLA